LISQEKIFESPERNLEKPSRVSVPGRAIHPDLSLAFAENDSIVAQNADVFFRGPLSRGGALSASGMAHE
jgi:hypothetical protein